MEGISAESNAMFIAFRRLVYNFSQQVNKDESQAIVYIRLYPLRERYKDSTTLEVLSKLEADGVLGPSNPEGLLEIAKDIKRQDLVSEVKDFIKKRSKSEKKASSSSNKKAAATQQLLLDENLYADTEEDMQLKATIEVTLAQATVLIQQVEILERSVVEGKVQRAKEAISEAEQTAAALAARLRKAQIELGLSTEQGEGASSAVSIPGRPHQNDDQPFYSNVVYPGEAIGTFSHSVSIGTSGKYALQPILTVQKQSPTCVQKQCSEIQGKSNSEKLKTVAEHDDEDEDEDDYEKMQSFVANEEEIKAWRMSLISQGTNYDRFTPPPRTDLHSSRPYSSQFSSATWSLNGREFRPYSYAPSSQHIPQPDARYIQHAAGASASYSSPQQSSGVATNAQTTNSPRSQRGEPNVNNSNSKGNFPPTSQLVSYRHSASPQTLYYKPTTTTIQAVKSPPTPPQRQLLHGASGSPTNRSPATPHSQPSGPGFNCSSQENGDNELDSCRSVTQQSGGESSGNVSLVKARLQELEKPATSAKPALLQKPNRPVARSRKPVSSTLKHNSSLQKELANINERETKAVSTMPRMPSSVKTSFTQLNKASNGSEDDAYSIMHRRGTSTSTVSNAGDSGFEDVRPLQRLDQEPDIKRDSHQPAAPIRPDAYTGLLNQKTTTSDRDGYSQVRCYTSRRHE